MIRWKAYLGRVLGGDGGLVGVGSGLEFNKHLLDMEASI